jgi:hypothetical protein
MTQEIKSCSNCKHFWYSSPQADQPYPEFACTEDVWDGISSQEELDSLSEETKCELHEFKKQITKSHPQGL